MLQEKNLTTTPLGKIITRNLMTGTKNPAQVLLPTKIGESIKFLVGIANPFRTNTNNLWNPLLNHQFYIKTK